MTSLTADDGPLTGPLFEATLQEWGDSAVEAER